ncbi:MAG: hypothetical protein VYE15_01440, partial [Myxococcota bacterium]|nr:hypothetical protein [Myxococcota bacterium]
DGGACRYIDGWEAYRCTTACSGDSECEDGYFCRLLPESETAQYCIPIGDPIEPEYSWADYYKWRVTNMVENIEVVRGIYDLYGYMIF